MISWYNPSAILVIIFINQTIFIRFCVSFLLWVDSYISFSIAFMYSALELAFLTIDDSANLNQNISKYHSFFLTN